MHAGVLGAYESRHRKHVRLGHKQQHVQKQHAATVRLCMQRQKPCMLQWALITLAVPLLTVLLRLRAHALLPLLAPGKRSRPWCMEGIV